ncbi:substrate-binding domain-containing protein [Desulfobulbus alkaliphilus]|uniref:substrate-binding domain-containing protein n=1 Tax=Desulfobulbus alkaliphilus TaxID=869814 RepID=UPI00196433FF|nr:substrate-binding domain-containing protein [Desulfobulbus alkaliphilus]MBM9537931.1 helix-turn-helix domain-containing protein [Desulfobulbus alkaliphilus]
MSGDKAELVCTLKAMRMARGISQKDLARRVGVGRQAIYDMESGRYVPNTALALRLARELGCKVEELFHMEGQQEKESIILPEQVDQPGTRLSVVRVNERLIAYPQDGKWLLNEGFHAADGLLDKTGRDIQLLQDAQRLENTILLLGCDPAFSILNAHVIRSGHGADLLCRFASSMRAMDGLEAGHAHLAAAHLHNIGTEEANVELARTALKKTPTLVIGFSLFEEGLMLQPGNPLGITTLADLTNKGVRFINRDRGAAIRLLFDDLLQRSGIQATSILGYNEMASGHIEGAQMVSFGLADAALGLRAVAATYDLDFMPLQFVRCDLIIPRDFLALKAVRILLDVLQSKALRRDLDSLPGYEAGMTGTVIAEL